MKLYKINMNIQLFYINKVYCLILPARSTILYARKEMGNRKVKFNSFKIFSFCKYSMENISK